MSEYNREFLIKLAIAMTRNRIPLSDELRTFMETGELPSSVGGDASHIDVQDETLYFTPFGITFPHGFYRGSIECDDFDYVMDEFLSMLKKDKSLYTNVYYN